MSTLKTKTLISIFLTSMLLIPQAAVSADNNSKDTNWILLGDSPLLDRSSKLLSNGKIKAGIKYANKALARSQSKYTHLIVAHNLCIAYLSQGEMALASEHCAQAGDLSMPDTYLKEIKPGLYKIARKRGARQESIALDALIAQNLQINGLNKGLSRVAQTN